MLEGLQQLVWWVIILVNVGGAVVSGMALEHSRWAGLLLVGFLGEALVPAFYRVLPIVLHGTGTPELRLIYFLGSLITLAAHLAVVGGVGGVLSGLGGPRGSSGSAQGSG
jgi:hypothetical protein